MNITHHNFPCHGAGKGVVHICCPRRLGWKNSPYRHRPSTAAKASTVILPRAQLTSSDGLPTEVSAGLCDMLTPPLVSVNHTTPCYFILTVITILNDLIYVYLFSYDVFPART